jgi:NAD(P)-dependent dehydrogenase (short-subunit alcohol dehydrogenase family)
MTDNFKGQVALVTGGASGIGRATALAFAEAGAQVVVSDVDVTGGQETVDLIEQAGGEATFFAVDVTQAQEVESLIAHTIETYGQLDCAFNNAGIAGEVGATVDCTEENWDRVIDINLKGVWLCMKYEIPHMLERGKGAIVNTASAAGTVALPSLPAYTASKHGVIGLTRNAAVEYAKEGIRVNAVCPGSILTPFATGLMGDDPEVIKEEGELHPVGRMGTPKEVAQAVLWLCSDDASFVTAHPMAVDGGLVAL